MTIKIAKFAKSFNQQNTIDLIYQNENAKVYSVKLAFDYYVCLTLNN